jgi:hypothetical protein
MSNERTAFSQGPMQQERIREILEPLWNKRFPVTKICVAPPIGSETSDDPISRIRRFP